MLEPHSTDVQTIPQKKARFRVRFSLRTFVIVMLLLASSGGLWWRWAPWSLERILQDGNGPAWNAQYSRDGRMIATAAGDGRIYDAESGKEIARLTGHKNGLLNADFSHDGKLVATCGVDHTARIWDAKTGREIHTLNGHPDWVTAVAFTSDDRKLFSMGIDGVRIWDVTAGTQLSAFSNPSWRVLFCASFSNDGKFLLLGSSDDGNAIGGHNGVAIMALETGIARIMDTDHGGKVSTAVYSPDNRQLLTSSVDGTAALWDAASGAKPVTFTGHQGEVHSAEFSPDGERILTSSYDHTVRIWDRSGLLLATLRGHRNAVYSAHFSPDGQHIVTASNDNTVRIWRRHRPEYVYGFLALPEFWMTVLLALALIYSLRRDWRELSPREGATAAMSS